MKPLEFSNQSWHYRLAKFGNQYRKVSDICSYTRSVITGACCLTLVVLTILVFLFPAAHTLAWMAAMVMTLSWIQPGELALVIPLLILVVLSLAAVTYLGKYLDERKRSDSFLSAARSSYLDKFCVPVKILDHKNPQQEN
jgi:cell division protein FtsW (lipid II flippase)